MIRINLLPVRSSKRQESVRNELFLGGLAALGLVGLLLVVHVLVLARVNSAKADNAALKDEIARKQAIVAEVDEQEKLKVDLKRKLDVIARLRANKVGPVHMLDELAIATPEKLFLTALDQDDKVLKITGQAVTNEVISEFLSKLEVSSFFTDVYLNQIDQVDRDGIKLKNFSVSAKLVVPGGEEPVLDAPAAGEKAGKAKAKAKAKATATAEAD
jgi:type IV pilus assembly protein PilN